MSDDHSPAGSVVAAHIAEFAQPAEIEIYRIGDRNLLSTVLGHDFQRNLDRYDVTRLTEERGAQVWKGAMTVEQTLNTDVTTAFPIRETIKDWKPGAYFVVVWNAATPYQMRASGSLTAARSGRPSSPVIRPGARPRRAGAPHSRSHPSRRRGRGVRGRRGGSLLVVRRWSLVLRRTTNDERRPGA